MGKRLELRAGRGAVMGCRRIFSRLRETDHRGSCGWFKMGKPLGLRPGRGGGIGCPRIFSRRAMICTAFAHGLSDDEPTKQTTFLQHRTIGISRRREML